MIHRILIALVVLTPAFADDPAAEIEPLMKTGAAAYVKADYEGARVSYEKAWELAQQTPSKNPVRYDILKRLGVEPTATGGTAFAH